MSVTYIAFSVVCSVVVSVLLKLAPRWQVDMRQAIAGSYLVASLLCMGFLRPHLSGLAHDTSATAWGVLIALGILLPSLFLVLAQSVVRVGVVRTDAAQRLSLLLPLIAAFTLFGEPLSWAKLIGMALGVVAIVCIVVRSDTGSATKTSDWYWPAIVFVGMGCIDILFKLMAQLTRVPFAGVLLATFLLAFILSLLYIGFEYGRGNASWGWQHGAFAVLIGAFNFGNIVFYIQAHRHLAHNPALVFSAMNIGVIVVAAVVGVLWFGERLGRLNRLGLALAILAVFVMAVARV